MGAVRAADLNGAPPASRRGQAIRAHVEAADGAGADWYHPRPSRAFNGQGPVETVSVQRLAGPDHWHLVTYGLGEPDGKKSSAPDSSGWGFELTLRLVSDEAPRWAVDLLASLAAYVGSSQHPFAEGHLSDFRGPIRLGSSTPITAAMVVVDPGLGRLAGPFGEVEFLQIVGLTADELELCRAWNVDGVRELLARDSPLLVTALDRPSVASDPRYQAEIEERARREGSSLHELRIGSLRLRLRRRRRGRADVQLGAGAAAALGPALRRELLAEGASFTVVGDGAELRFSVGPDPAWHWTEDGLEATVATDGIEYVAGLFDGRTGWGRASDWPGLRFRIVR